MSNFYPEFLCQMAEKAAWLAWAPRDGYSWSERFAQEFEEIRLAAHIPVAFAIDSEPSPPSRSHEAILSATVDVETPTGDRTVNASVFAPVYGAGQPMHPPAETATPPPDAGPVRFDPGCSLTPVDEMMRRGLEMWE